MSVLMIIINFNFSSNHLKTAKYKTVVEIIMINEEERENHRYFSYLFDFFDKQIFRLLILQRAVA